MAEARAEVVNVLSTKIDPGIDAAYDEADRNLDAEWIRVRNAINKIIELDREYSRIEDTHGFAVVGELVKNAFFKYKSNLYLADNNGDIVTSKAILISDDAHITQGSTTYENAYVLFGSDGKAVTGYEGRERTIVIGGVSYWSTNETVTYGDDVVATVFVSNRTVNNKR